MYHLIVKEIVSECMLKDPTKRMSIKDLASKQFVKDRVADINEKLYSNKRGQEMMSPLERLSSLSQEKGENTVGRSDTHKLTSTSGVEVHLSELTNAASVKMELIRMELEKMQRKNTQPTGFKLGVNISNFMVGLVDTETSVLSDYV